MVDKIKFMLSENEKYRFFFLVIVAILVVVSIFKNKDLLHHLKWWYFVLPLLAFYLVTVITVLFS